MQADKPIKLEAGKYYRTRDGRKVGPMKEYIVAESFIEVRGDGRWWELDGTGKNMAEGFDLIAEWVDEPDDLSAPMEEADSRRDYGLLLGSSEGAPSQLRFAADIIDDVRAGIPSKMPWSGNFDWRLEQISNGYRKEAARREAEAKPVKISQPECHEPGGCIAPVACVQFGKCPQKPEAAPQGEREGPGSAAADIPLVAPLYRRIGSLEEREFGRVVNYVPERYEPVGFTLAEVRGVLAEAKHVLSAARLKPFLPLLKEPRDGE